jgi:hypothetical protein
MRTTLILLLVHVVQIDSSPFRSLPSLNVLIFLTPIQYPSSCACASICGCLCNSTSSPRSFCKSSSIPTLYYPLLAANSDCGDAAVLHKEKIAATVTAHGGAKDAASSDSVRVSKSTSSTAFGRRRSLADTGNLLAPSPAVASLAGGSGQQTSVASPPPLHAVLYHLVHYLLHRT